MTYPSTTLYPGPNTFPGTAPNGGGEEPPVVNPHRIEWSRPSDRQTELGLDRGVLYPKNGEAAAWNGLTGVDEDGGESAVEYYIDGRPFLYFPKPKEYKAQLRAYTYPDAFAELIGEVEAADGMYLDSQVGDSFDLSYRTLIADAIQGNNAGYKIHLIYNATAIPSAKAFGTLTESINPIEFAWGIQAVPVRVTGYRPTAHVIISTKHMDATRLQELEDLLYGTPETDPVMPDPQIIFDLLSFGDAIIITDNGDGTWMAEGSYHNIYMIGDEIFEIDNVDAVDHGDGTFTISSTP